jgi:hypothetical protein
LVAEDGSQELGAIIFKPTMTDNFVEFKQVFEPLVKRFDRRAAPTIVSECSRVARTTCLSALAKQQEALQFQSVVSGRCRDTDHEMSVAPGKAARRNAVVMMVMTI